MNIERESEPLHARDASGLSTQLGPGAAEQRLE